MVRWWNYPQRIPIQGSENTIYIRLRARNGSQRRNSVRCPYGNAPRRNDKAARVELHGIPVVRFVRWEILRSRQRIPLTDAEFSAGRMTSWEMGSVVG